MEKIVRLSLIPKAGISLADIMKQLSVTQRGSAGAVEKCHSIKPRMAGEKWIVKGKHKEKNFEKIQKRRASTGFWQTRT